MALDELELMRTLGSIEAKQAGIQGEIREFKEIVDGRFTSHGKRLGDDIAEVKQQHHELENRLNLHMEKTKNGNGRNGTDWRDRAKFGTGGTLGGVFIVKLFDFFMGG